MKKFLQGTMFYIALIFVIMSLVFIQSNSTSKVEKIPFSEFYTSILEHKVSEVEIQDNGMIQGKMAGSDKVFTTYAGYLAKTDGLTKEILEQTQQGVLKSKVKEPTQTHWILDLLPMVMLILIIVAFWFIFVQQAQGGGSKVMGFGKSRAKLHKEDENIKITFNDVAGLQEEKEELKEIVDFLRSPQKYWNLGARIPKGILMVGPPGTGKTYLSKAVAGEAGVPFYSISGSDFVEMFVGVGASRVRDLFEQAKKTAPCIIFIDEIDAVGRKRGAGLGGGHDEREQTLNQLLVEMDGFRVNESIIVMAATNRPDILDPALLRPGRFDRQVMVGSPDVKGREEILKVHSRKKPLAEDVDLKEAALLTARNNGTKIKMQTIEEAIVKTIVGLAKKSRIITEDEKKLTAYHEAGHAILATVQKFCDPVHQVTIIPRGMAGGFTMSRPQEDRYYTTKQELKEKMVELLGGRVAEELILEDVSTGASNDLERVAKIARAMVTTYAMTDKLGAMAYGDSSDEVFLGKDFTTKPNYSEEVASQIDHEIKIIVDEAYATARKLLQENIDRLHNVAQALMVYETLDSEQFKKAFNGELDLNEDVEESISEGADTFFDGEKSDDAKVSDENSDISETPINGESGVVVDVTTSVDASEQK